MFDVASVGTYGELHCTDDAQIDLIEQKLQNVIPGVKVADTEIGIDGKRCGIRFEKNLDVFFRNKVTWWLIAQLCASGWQLISVDAGVRYFVRTRDQSNKKLP
jgi:hypothetical protein